jgi:hypothetical protein
MVRADYTRRQRLFSTKGSRYLGSSQPTKVHVENENVRNSE